MPKIILLKNNDGHLEGLGEKDKTAWDRLKKKWREMEPGECVVVETWFDRNSRLQGLHHRLMHAVWDAQELYDDYDEFRASVYCAVGYSFSFPGLDGRAVRMARSTSYSSIDDSDFGAVHEKCVKWFYSDSGTRTLWPHLSETDQMEMISTLLEPFSEENRRLWNEEHGKKNTA